MADAPSAPVLRLAHRGDHRRFAENSTSALLAALRVPGCDGVEFDVRAARDGVPVVLHDETLTRVHGRRARAADLTADELEPMGIPRLSDVLLALPRWAFLDVELKEDLGRSVVEALVSSRGAHLRAAVVSSFLPVALERIRGLAPGWPCWLNLERLTAGAIRTAGVLGCAGVSVEHGALDPASVGRAKAAGLAVAAWTVTEPGEYERLADLGVVAICVEGAALDDR